MLTIVFLFIFSDASLFGCILCAIDFVRKISSFVHNFDYFCWCIIFYAFTLRSPRWIDRLFNPIPAPCCQEKYLAKLKELKSLLTQSSFFAKHEVCLLIYFSTVLLGVRITACRSTVRCGTIQHWVCWYWRRFWSYLTHPVISTTQSLFRGSSETGVPVYGVTMRTVPHTAQLSWRKVDWPILFTIVSVCLDYKI